jgi:hypothetical protein
LPRRILPRKFHGQYFDLARCVLQIDKKGGRMNPILHQAVVVAYRETASLGGPTEEAFEAAVAVVHEALPDAEDDEARALTARMISSEPSYEVGDTRPPPGARPRRFYC